LVHHIDGKNTISRQTPQLLPDYPCGRDWTDIVYGLSYRPSHKRGIMQDISLEWSRDALGYHLVEATPPAPTPNTLLALQQGLIVPDLTFPELWRASSRADPGQPERIVRAGGSLVPYRPTETLDLIFREFLNADPTAEGVLDFINRFGPLTRSGNKEEGEPVTPVIDALRGMTELVELSSLNKDAAKRSLAKHLGADGIRLTGVEVRLLFDERTQSLRTQQVAHDLRAALTLRLYEVMASDVVMRRCGHCNALFTAGLGTGRHLNAKFCSDEHRVLFNSLKRTPKAA
jgi:hypothetical protein